MSNEPATTPKRGATTAATQQQQQQQASASSFLPDADQKATASDPSSYDDPAGWLKARGWRPLGDWRHPDCKWLDPSRPLVAREEMKTVLQIKDDNGIVMREIKQLHHTAPAWPMALHEAIAAQIARDDEPVIAALKREQREALLREEEDRLIAERAEQRGDLKSSFLGGLLRR